MPRFAQAEINSWQVSVAWLNTLVFSDGLSFPSLFLHGSPAITWVPFPDKLFMFVSSPQGLMIRKQNLR